MTDHAFYAAQSPITDPGPFADRVAAVPGTLTSMRTAARELVFHYRPLQVPSSREPAPTAPAAGL